MELYRQKQTKTSCCSLQVLLRARHLEQGGRPAASLPVRRGAQEHRGDRLQWLLDTPQHPPTPRSTPPRPLLEAWRLLLGPEDVPLITLSLFQVLPELTARIFTSTVARGRRLRGPSDDGLRSESSRLGGTDAFRACSTRKGTVQTTLLLLLLLTVKHLLLGSKPWKTLLLEQEGEGGGGDEQYRMAQHPRL